MKKILLVGAFVISAFSFANTHAGHNMADMKSGTAGMGSMMNGEMGSMMSPEMKVMMEAKGMMKDGKCTKMENGMMGGKDMMKGGMMNMTPEQKKAMETDMIAIQEKQLEVRKLMNTAKPDTKKIEKLNAEIATMRTKHMESMQKMMAAPAKTN